jgi:lysophospholipase L1-like esterase
MDANLNFVDGVTVTVTNDGTPANNGDYIKSGAAGAGSWVQSSFDRVAVVENRATAVESKTAGMDGTNYNRSGYVWALVDANDKIAIGIKADGTVEVGDQKDIRSILALVVSRTPQIDLVSTYFSEFGQDSGYAWALVDANDKAAICVYKSGRVEIAGKQVATKEALDAITPKAVGTKDIVCWGDSLTEGSGGTPFPAQLATLAGLTIINEGFGGQTTDKILARQGGCSALVTVSGNSIPTSGAVAVTLNTNMLSYPTAATLSVVGYLAGVLGTLTKDTSDNYTFTRSAAGSATTVAPGTPFTVSISTRNVNKSNFDLGINVFWCGSNDVGTASIGTIAAQIDNAIAKLTAPEKRLIILGPINNVAFTSGTQAYTDMRTEIAKIQGKYPRNFIDIQSLLVYSYNAGIPQDVTDFGNKVPPSSLRSDSIHLNTAGYAVVTNAVKSLLDMKGWLL